jgi:hypothetical protein
MKKFGITVLHAQSFFFHTKDLEKSVSTPAQAACTYQGPEIDKNDSLICFGDFFLTIRGWSKILKIIICLRAKI